MALWFHRLRQMRLALILALILGVHTRACAGTPPKNQPSPHDAAIFNTLLQRGALFNSGKHWKSAVKMFNRAWRIAPDRPDVLASLAVAESHLPGRQCSAIAWFRAFLASQRGMNNPRAALVRNRIRELAVSEYAQESAQLRELKSLAGHLPFAEDRDRATAKISRLKSLLTGLQGNALIRQSRHPAIYSMWKWAFVAANIHSPAIVMQAAAQWGKNERSWRIFLSQYRVVKEQIRHFSRVQRHRSTRSGQRDFIRYRALRFYLLHIGGALHMRHHYQAWRMTLNVLSLRPSALDMARAAVPGTLYPSIAGRSAADLHVFDATRAVRNLYLPLNIGLEFASRYNNRARMKARLGLWQLAVRDYQRVIHIYARLHQSNFLYDSRTTARLARSESFEYTLLGQALSHLHRDRQAADALRVALSILPNNSAAANAIRRLQRIRRDESAIAACTKAIGVGGQVARWYARRGELYRRLGGYHHALADASAAVARQPSMLSARRLKMRTEMRLGEIAPAIADASILIAAMPANGDLSIIYIDRAKMYARLGQPLPALQDYDAALRVAPGSITACAGRMRVELALQKWDAAAADAASVLRLHPPAALYHAAVGVLRTAAHQNSRLAMLYLGRLLAWGRVTAPDYNAGVAMQLNGSDAYVRPGGFATDGAKSAIWFRRAAKDGSGRATAAMGALHLSANGVALDDAAARRWFSRGAAMGCPDAMDALGWMDEFDASSKKPAVALHWFRRAAAAGYAKSINSVGQCYLKGWGVAKNYPQAMLWFRKAAKGGYASAASNIGYMYDNGLGVSKNISKAVMWYKRAAAMGDPLNLGFCYQDGDGVTANPEKAMEYFTLNNTASYDEACFLIGRSDFVEFHTKAAYARALLWFRRAAAMGDARAMNFIGVMYRRGYALQHNDVNAVKWYRRAAAAGDAYAMHNLALASRRAHGTPLDYRRAMFWWQRAASLNLAQAQCWIGNMFHDGQAVPFSYSAHDRQAVKYWRAAAAAGSIEAMKNMSDARRDGLGVTVSHFKAVRWLARTNDASAMDDLGICYQFGDGVAVNLAMAAHWYHRAARYGSTDGMVRWAVAAKQGSGVKPDPAAAIRWFTKAADRGSGLAMCWLGSIYDEGKIVSRQPLVSIAWYKKSVAAGSSRACENLGATYALGDGVPVNYSAALTYFRIGAARKSKDCMNWLAYLYNRGMGVATDKTKAVLWHARAGQLSAQKRIAADFYNGSGVKQNYAAAVKWYRRAAMQGSAQAMRWLAWCYQNGHGTTVNDPRAWRWYRKSAAKGNLLAAYSIGYFYHKGLAVPQNDRKAVSWFRKTAHRGCRQAMAWLGWSYLNGRGVPEDDTAAVKWFRKAANSGSVGGLSFMAYCYDNGRGVPVDHARAAMWKAKLARAQRRH